MTLADLQVPTAPPISSRGLDLVEVNQIRVLLLQDAESREEARSRQKSRRAVLTESAGPAVFLASLVSLPVSFVHAAPLWLALNGLLVVSTFVPLTVLPMFTVWRAIKRRGVESVRWANTLAQRQDQLSAQLLTHSRAALLRVADEYAGAEQGAGRRAVVFLGASKLGFIGWSALFITGSAALLKVLTEPALKVSPLIQQGTWWAFLIVLSASLGALLASHSNNALLQYSDLLRGLAAAKKTAAEEAKEEREALKAERTS